MAAFPTVKIIKDNLRNKLIRNVEVIMKVHFYLLYNNNFINFKASQNMLNKFDFENIYQSNLGYEDVFRMFLIY